MSAVIVIGTQWGDEGKGKVVDLLTARADGIVRAQGGNNAGHTIVFDGQEYKLHMIPSGILQPGKQCFIGAGTVINPVSLVDELDGLESRGIDVTDRLWISESAHVVFPYHCTLDTLMEKCKGTAFIGTTGRGIGPCYADKANRLGIRMAELLRPEHFLKTLQATLEVKNRELISIYDASPVLYEEIYETYRAAAERLRPYITSVRSKLSKFLSDGNHALFEGAQGTFLDNTSGTYPYVTSSCCLAGGICSGSEVGPTQITHTLGVAKAYTTRVGNGPLPTVVSDGENFVCHERDREMGTTSGRKRRIGWFDAVLVREAIRLNGVNSLAVMKLDILDRVKNIKVCTHYSLHGKDCDHVPALVDDMLDIQPQYEVMPGWCSDTSKIRNFDDLPTEAKNYIKRMEELVGVPIVLVSTGPDREQTMTMAGRHPFSQAEACT